MKKYAWIAGLVFAADQISKMAARGLTDSITLIPGVIGLRHCENTGMAFSLLSGRSWMLGILSLLLVAVGWLILRPYRMGNWSQIAAMLMLGGAVGNAVDRLWQGSVTDMIELLFVRFAVFNLADAALTVGCVLMAVSLLLKPEEWVQKGSEQHG